MSVDISIHALFTTLPRSPWMHSLAPPPHPALSPTCRCVQVKLTRSGRTVSGARGLLRTRWKRCPKLVLAESAHSNTLTSGDASLFRRQNDCPEIGPLCGNGASSISKAAASYVVRDAPPVSSETPLIFTARRLPCSVEGDGAGFPSLLLREGRCVTTRQ